MPCPIKKYAGKTLGDMVVIDPKALSWIVNKFHDDKGTNEAARLICEYTWKFTVNQRGILIPVRDDKGQIQGMQIRRDDVKKRKFRWVSSTELKNGCKAEGWTHLAGLPAETILLTEGPMKADVIHALTGLTVLAVPGVNALTQLEIALKQLRQQGLKKIMTAFDMDMATNPHVQNGYQQLLLLLDGMGLQFGTYLWDGSYKGLDDYIWEFCLKRNRS